MKKLIKVIPIIILLFVFVGCKKNQSNQNNNTIDQAVYCVVTFDSQGGSQVSSQQVEKGSKANKPIDPTKAGYTFVGWYYGEQEWIFIGYVVSENMTLTAKWKQSDKEYVTVSFDSQGGSSVNSQQVKKGNPIAVVNNPTKIGYTFEGWYYGDEKWSFISNVVLINITLTARWNANTYNVTLDLDGGTGISQTLLVIEYDSYCTLPTPNKIGYTFEGWYNGEQKIESGNWKIASNITLKAKYSPNTYSITFNPDGGSGLTSNKMNVTYNSSFTLPTVIRDDYTFEGWYYGNTKVESGIWTYTTNLTLTAKWKSEYVTVSFDSQGGSTVESQQVKPGTNANKPNDPIRAGYYFEGWFINDEQWGFDSNKVTDNIRLTAKWHSIFKTIVNNNEITITGLNDNNIVIIEIPAIIDGIPVTSIGEGAFAENTNIISVIISDGIKTIENSAFAYCDYLESIIIPNSVIFIGNRAIFGCYNLTGIVIPNSVTFIGKDAFYACSSLTIYCEVSSKPGGWNSDWNGTNCPVVWGYTGE